MQESLPGDKLNDKMYHCSKIAVSVISKMLLISLFLNSFLKNANVFKRWWPTCTCDPHDFSSSHVWIWELDYKESWALKNWCFWTVVLEKTLESPLDCKEVQQVHPKGDQSWVFIGKTDIEAETPIFWPPDVKSWLIWKDPDARKDWGQEEKGMTEDEMIGWHHQLNGHEFWVNSGSWWWTGRPGVLPSMGSQRVGHDWATEPNPLQYSCLGNPMDRGAWQATVHGVTKSQTRLSDWTELNWWLLN